MSTRSDANKRYFEREDAIAEEVRQFRQDLREDGLSEGACFWVGLLLERIIRVEGTLHDRR